MQAMFVFTSILLILAVIVADDRIRPQYHLMPPQYWLNDPNGPVYFNGYYHMFYQYYPDVVEHGRKQWGHCYSKDMVHWIRLPVAIVPSQPYDINGIWTGSTTIVNGTPTIIYTGINTAGTGVQCLAVASNLSDPTLTNWTKSPLNPLITSPEGRDPSAAFKDSQNNYYLIYGYGTELGGQVLLFTSKDFRKWTYLHPFHSNHNGDFWDCPDLFPLSNRMVLKAGLLDHDFWALGNIDPVKLIFTPINGDLGEFTQLIDYGRFYASKSFYDPVNNQQVIVGWTAEQDNLGPQRGWQGMLTLPRAVFLSSDGLQLRTRPIEELKTLRDPSSHLQYTDIAIEREFPFELIPNVKGNQIEIVVNWQFPMNQNLDFGISVLSTLDGSQRTSIGITTLKDTSVMISWDFIGWDYSNVPNVTQWVDCQSACDKDNKCQSWTFDASKEINNNCFLKTGVPFKQRSWTCVSGVKQQGNNQQLVWIYINRVISQRNPGADHSPIGGIVWMDSTVLDDQWSLELDIFIDHSIIEIFEPQGGRVAITGRVYPEEEDAENLAVYALHVPNNNDSVIMKSFDFWSLNTIWT